MGVRGNRHLSFTFPLQSLQKPVTLEVTSSSSEAVGPSRASPKPRRLYGLCGLHFHRLCSVPRLPAPVRYCHSPSHHARSPDPQSQVGIPTTTSTPPLNFLKQLRELRGEDSLEHIYLLGEKLQSIRMRRRTGSGVGKKGNIPAL